MRASSACALRHQRADLLLDHDRPVEDVAFVLEDVGLERHHLLNAQRPLLVPRPRQAERLIPRRQLDRAGARLLRQRHGERLQDDALDVVLRLLGGEPERIDLYAVAEAPLARLADAVALGGEPVPQPRERLQLADLLDEADAGVDEERELADDVGNRDAGALLHPIEDCAGVREREGDLLHRRRPGLLQVVAAQVHRVPRRDLADRVLDDVGGEAQRLLGREDVRAAREELLDDVVLGRAAQLAVIRALAFGGGHV